MLERAIIVNSMQTRPPLIRGRLSVAGESQYVRMLVQAQMWLLSPNIIITFCIMDLVKAECRNAAKVYGTCISKVAVHGIIQ